MNMRGAGLATLGVALVAMLAGCGGGASASEPSAVAPSAEVPVDVEAVARDEIAALDELGYPTQIATWAFADEYTNSAGGTASTSGDRRGYSAVVMSLDADAYSQFSPDIEAAVRSTVRHEFGHALTYWLYPSGAEGPMAEACPSVSTGTLKTGAPGGECSAEVVSELLARERGDERVRFYKLALSDESISAIAPILDGSPAWDVPTE